MNKMKSNALAMMAMAIAMQDGKGMMFSGNEDKAVVYLPKEQIAPLGTKTYFFNQLGGFSTEKMRKDECVFKCFAINDKNAIRKFEKYIKLN